MSRNGHQYAKASGVATFSGLPEVSLQSRTDIVYQEILLYIEGVQVPFEYISVSNTYGGMPEASISIPYYSGLSEICKGYFPKVHVFFRDITFEKYLLNKGEEVDEKDIRRLLFSGVIVGTEYSKRRSTEGDSVSISFRCMHKYYAVREVIVKMIGAGIEQLEENTLDAAATAKAHYFNSDAMFLDALRGIKIKIESSDKPIKVPQDPDNPDTDVIPNHLPKELENYAGRYSGIPGVLLALWHILKRDSYNRAGFAQIMTELYIPLLDDGLSFFKRMTGHSTIEGTVETDRKPKDESEYLKKVEESKTYPSDSTLKVLVPPGLRNMVQEASSIDMGTVVMKSAFQSSGELVDFYTLAGNMLRAMRYDIEILACPIQSKTEGLHGIDVLVKPLMPFYFSPICNVYLPHMFSSVSMQDFTYSTPTRCLAQSSIFVRPENGGQGGPTRLVYRAPMDVRNATASNRPNSEINLKSTTLKIGEYPTPAEFGRGVKVKPLGIDPWVNYLFSSREAEASTGGDTGGGQSGNATPPPGNEELVDGLYVRAYYKNPNSQSFKENQKLINPETSEKENMDDKTRVWKYWDKSKVIPKYIASTSVSGKNMVYGKKGFASGADNTAIEKFRKDTEVPKFWDVYLFPGDKYMAIPPHYDYMAEIFFKTDALVAAINKNGGKDPYRLPKEEPKDKPAASEESAKKAEEQSAQNEQATKDAADKGKSDPSSGTAANDQKIINSLRDYWNYKYPGQPGMNPYEDKSINGIEPYQSSLFSVVEYDYSLSLVESRVGNLDGPFNPYIITGYPMDIIEASPERPSLHAFCTSVTHSISASNISTTVGFTSAMTYDELRAYDLPALLPWFQLNLGMLTKLSLIDQTDSAKQKANSYYLDTIGVGYADPSIMEDPTTGGGASLIVNNKGSFTVDTLNIFQDEYTSTVSQAYLDSANPNKTYEGNLTLIRREIESMSDVESLNEVKFVDIQNRNTWSSVEEVKVSPTFRTISQKPGRSLFLNYANEDEALMSKLQAPVPKSDSEKGS